MAKEDLAQIVSYVNDGSSSFEFKNSVVPISPVEGPGASLGKFIN